MTAPEAFRSGTFSIPQQDADDLPACCFACVYLSYKEFSMGEGSYYYFCSCSWRDEINRAAPLCLAPGAT